jgi:hypothetical protein
MRYRGDRSLQEIGVSEFVLPSRQVHLDFHNGPAIHDIGVAFDPDTFAQTFVDAHVNSVTLFAKCHHGHLYYNTNHPARHPGLAKDLGLLEKQVEALHKHNIRAPIYLSVLCDEYAADTHPEWLAKKPDGTRVGPRMFEPGWQILDMSSPYADYVAEQLREVLEHFKPVDGIFLDMCWDQPSYGAFTVSAMMRKGLDPRSEPDQKKFAHEVSLAYMKRYTDMIKASSPQASYYFNSRPLVNLANELDYLTQVEIEALPTGGWGYGYFPKNVRLARTFDKPLLGMTARFHKGWADFGGIKPDAALEYETSLMMAHGTRVSIGDQLHPRGTLDKAAYALIGKTMARVEAREPWLENAKPLAQIGLFQVPRNDYFGETGADEGAVKILTQLKYPFDVVRPDSNWSAYELLILPDAVPITHLTAEKLRAYLKAGGKILASGTSTLTPDGAAPRVPEMGIEAHGMSPLTTQYLRFRPDVSQDVPPTDHVMYDRAVQVTPSGDGHIVVQNVEPYFERAWNHFSSHFQTPADKVSTYAAAVVTANTAYIAAPIFGAYIRHGNYPYRLLVRNLLARLLPQRWIELDNVPLSLEVSVMSQADRIIVHLLNYAAERRTGTLDIIEDVPVLRDVTLSLKQDKRPQRVYLAPEGTDLPWDHTAGRVQVNVPELRGHAMLVVE